MEATEYQYPRPLTVVKIGDRSFAARSVSRQTIGSDVITTIVEADGRIRQFLNDEDLCK